MCAWNTLVSEIYTRVLSQKTAKDKLVPSYDLKPESCRQKHRKELEVSSASVSQSYTAQPQLLLLNTEVLNTQCALPKSSAQKFSKLRLNNFYLQTTTAYPPSMTGPCFHFYLSHPWGLLYPSYCFNFQEPHAAPHIRCSLSGAFLMFHIHTLHHILALPLKVCSFSI